MNIRGWLVVLKNILNGVNQNAAMETMNRLRVVVTGGAGFIGSAVI
jgi:hypothetical protein